MNEQNQNSFDENLILKLIKQIEKEFNVFFVEHGQTSEQSRNKAEILGKTPVT